MKADIGLKIQKGVTYALIIIAIITFVLGLGFMTDYYQLFYDGSQDMFNYYKDLQVLNKVIFQSTVAFIVLSFLLLAFDIHKKKAGVLGWLFVLGLSVYMITNSLTIVSAIPSYQQEYLAFDFSIIENYSISTMSFSMSRVLFTALTGLAVILLSVVTINTIKKIKASKGSMGGTYGA